ncbi:MAG TPA: alpha/beta fold hydrolase [Candidatus Polarisedimenticolia bacterium]|nr:alpha/beta fold hydrolase [Candidatus Polarisedimenticolia bacterium]
MFEGGVVRGLVLLAVLVAGMGAIHPAPSAAATSTKQEVSFPADDGWIIHADAYGAGSKGVVLVHGGRFTKESWEKQAQALVKSGYHVLAIDMRGFGSSKEGPAALNLGYGSPLDVLAAVRYLRETGAKSVSIIGGSMGANAATGASIESQKGEIDALILLAGGEGGPAEEMKGRKLFVVTRDDAGPAGPRIQKIREQFAKAPKPKQLLILEGSAHAQYIFETDQGDRLMKEILRFLANRKT